MTLSLTIKPLRFGPELYISIGALPLVERFRACYRDFGVLIIKFGALQVIFKPANWSFPIEDEEGQNHGRGRNEGS